MTLPAGWQAVTLGELTEPSRASVSARESGLPYIGLEHVESQTMRLRGTGDSTALKGNARVFEPGSILYARLRPYLNKVYVPEFAGVASTEFYIFPPSDALAPRFLAYLLNGPEVVEFANRYSEGIERPRVAWTRLAQLPVALPPLPEQQRIVAAIEEQFSRLDAALGSTHASRARLEALRTSILGKLDALPLEHSVGEVAEVRGGIQKQPKRRPAVNAYPFLRVANVLRGRLDLAEVHRVELFEGELDRYRLQAGDLLVVEGNGSREQIGRSALWSGEIGECVHQNHLIRVRPEPLLDPDYLALYWNAPGCAERLAQVASTTSGLYTLSVSKLQRLRIAVPPLDEQSQMVAEIEQQLSLIDSLRATVESARKRSAALRRAILERAFRGELVPQGPDDEPASVLLERIRAERASAPKPTRRKRVPA